MGVRLAPSDVWENLRRQGIEPTPRRSGPTWSEFLRTQAATMLACDFFTLDPVLLRHLHMLFFVEIDTRWIHLSGVTANPAGEWVTQQGPNLSRNSPNAPEQPGSSSGTETQSSPPASTRYSELTVSRSSRRPFDPLERSRSPSGSWELPAESASTDSAPSAAVISSRF